MDDEIWIIFRLLSSPRPRNHVIGEIILGSELPFTSSCLHFTSLLASIVHRAASGSHIKVQKQSLARAHVSYDSRVVLSHVYMETLPQNDKDMTN